MNIKYDRNMSIVKEIQAGAPISDVARHHGITRQAAHQIYWKYITGKEKKCSVFPNLDLWMKSKSISALEMARTLDIKYSTFRNQFAFGASPKKENIDKVLKFTGMKYETLFSEVVEDGEVI